MRANNRGNKSNYTVASTVERQLEGNVEQCTTIAAVNTTFNADTRVPTYVGMMFEIFPRMELELLTLELDVRIPEDELEGADLSVEVYTMKGSYELLHAYDENRWSLISKGTAVLLPGGQGAIIPRNEFSPLKIEAKERRSFYVTMKKSYLDHNVMALQKTGELQLRTPELDILVGVGFNQYKFPGDYDRLLDPQFAGVMHFRRTAECGLTTTTTTTVEFIYLIGEKASSELVLQLNEAVNEAIGALMEEETVFLKYQEDYELQITQDARSGKTEYEGKSHRARSAINVWQVLKESILLSSRNVSNKLGILSHRIYSFTTSLCSSRYLGNRDAFVSAVQTRSSSDEECRKKLWRRKSTLHRTRELICRRHLNFEWHP